jgi:hypothetical protein
MQRYGACRTWLGRQRWFEPGVMAELMDLIKLPIMLELPRNTCFRSFPLASLALPRSRVDEPRKKKVNSKHRQQRR